MAKSPDAFRTISEVADWLGIQAHVLRFWESKFTQVKPIKRAGGRRYYRPNDMLLLGGIRQLLHEDGLTIKGVQKILREEGMSHVAGLSQPLDELTQSQLEDGSTVHEAPMLDAAPVQESAVVLNFDSAPVREPEAQAPAAVLDATAEPTPSAVESPEAQQAPSSESVEPAAAAPQDVVAETDAPAPFDPLPEAEPETPVVKETTAAEQVATVEETSPAEPAEDAPGAAKLPAFLRRPLAVEPTSTDNPPAEAAEVEPAPPAPKPRIIDMPPITPMDQITASPALLTAAFRTRSLSAARAQQVAPLLDRLTVLRDSMAARRGGGANAGPDA